jgi:hypothetical protein
MIMLMIAAVVADMSASAAAEEAPLSWGAAASPKSGTPWVLPDLDYGNGTSCPPLVERPLNDRMTLSIGPNCGSGPSNRPDPVGSILPED